MNMHPAAAGATAAAALEYAAACIPCFPCGPDKAPLVPGGFKSASADAAQVAEWWRRWPAALVAIPTGAASGLLVVDADVDRATGESVGEATLAAMGVDLSRAPSAVTRSGGRHWYFRHADGLGCSAGKIGLKVDTRGEGGYIIAPPSPGYRWEWLSVLDLGRDNLPEVPPELLAKLRAPKADAGGFQFDHGRGIGGDRETTLAEAAEIVHTINPDCGFGDWLAVLMGVHDLTNGSAAGLTLADDWSRRGTKYKAGEVAAKWATFAAGGGTTWASVAAIARQHGADLAAIARRHKGGGDHRDHRGAWAGASPDVDPDTEAGPTPITPTPFTLRHPSTIPPRRWLYGGHLIAGYVSLTVSPGGLGKSSLALVEALAMATGSPLLGASPPRPLRVWCWNGEDPREEMERRLAAACLHYGITPEAIGGRLYADSGRDMPLLIAAGGRDGPVVNRAAVEALVEAVTARRVDVLIADPFVTTHAVSENDNGAINAVVAAWREVADRTGAAVELVHHAAKAAHAHGGEMGVAQSRGASALIDGVRSARYLVAMSQDEAARAGLETPRGLFRVEMGKANLAPRPDRADWRRMASVSLGNGSDAYPEGDHVGVAESWDWPDPFDGLDVGTLRDVQTALADGEGRADEQAAAWAGHRVAEVMGLDMGGAKGRTGPQQAGRQRVKQLLAGWIKSGALVKEARHSAKHGRDLQYLIPADDAAPVTVHTATPPGVDGCGGVGFADPSASTPPPLYRGGECGVGGEGQAEGCGSPEVWRAAP